MDQTRRTFCILGAKLGVLPLVGCQKTQGDGPKPKASVDPAKQRRAILSAVADRIIPSEPQSAGANAAKVGAHLETIWRDPNLAQFRSLLSAGAEFLEGLSQKQNGAAFVALKPSQQDVLLRKMADKKVRPDRFRPDLFMKVMIAFTLEGFLGENIASNQDGVGFAALGFEKKEFHHD